MKLKELIAKLTALLLLILSSGVAQAQTCVPLPTGVVSWWAAEGDAMDLADSNHGTPINGATFAAGVVGQAFSFDGVDDAVLVPDAPNLNPTTQVSIEAWVFPIANSGSSDVVAMIVNKEIFRRWVLSTKSPDEMTSPVLRA